MVDAVLTQNSGFRQMFLSPHSFLSILSAVFRKRGKVFLDRFSCKLQTCGWAGGLGFCELLLQLPLQLQDASIERMSDFKILFLQMGWVYSNILVNYNLRVFTFLPEKYWDIWK